MNKSSEVTTVYQVVDLCVRVITEYIQSWNGHLARASDNANEQSPFGKQFVKVTTRHLEQCLA